MSNQTDPEEELTEGAVNPDLEGLVLNNSASTETSESIAGLSQNDIDTQSVSTADVYYTSTTKATSLLKVSPYPDPEDLRRYEEIHPGAADRIFKLAEQEQANRHDLKKLLYSAQCEEMKRVHESDAHARNSAVLVSIVLAGSAVLIAIWGNSWSSAVIGSIIGAGSIASVVKSFMNGRSSPSDDDDDEQEESADSE
ncbi:DUF2335 domain-containing protein [Gimesia fumaroli]|uniref:DUF2335 domain-containing protein n=1 Tax=Gimesia fumaroli TaxID=2527976 RepID=A0A518IKS8_9PLAN|nr:DUF2335 domain-containing protein [Gimesia fumaroli]QDV53684.1 hypothetical protein Enr17x_57650 [Gimesia fumaroli]